MIRVRVYVQRANDMRLRQVYPKYSTSYLSDENSTAIWGQGNFYEGYISELKESVDLELIHQQTGRKINVTSEPEDSYFEIGEYLVSLGVPEGTVVIFT